MNGPTLTLPVGTDRDFTLQFQRADGSAATDFLSSDTLAGIVWTGDDLDALANPAVSWVDADEATVLVSFEADDTTDLLPGKYQFRVEVTRSGRTGVPHHGWLVLTASPGAATDAAAFVTADQMRVYAPWIDDLMTASDQAGFLEQRARATTWLIDLLCDRWRPSQTSWSLGDRTAFGEWIYDRPSTWLREKLEADPTHLIARPKLYEILAKKAIAFVCESQIGREGSDNYLNLAAHFHGQSNALLATYKAEIDVGTTMTSTVGLVIDCGVGSLI